MVNMAKIPITATLGALSRYAAGGVNPYTACVGQTICKALFRLKQPGRANMKQALSKLPCCSTLGSALYIGFGIEHLVRNMATTEEGTICLALCAALAECIPSEVASEVLLEIARRCSIDSKYLPSNSEWDALLKSCAGVLATTTFPLKCEGFMRLSQKDRDTWTSGYGVSPNARPYLWDSYRVSSTSESLADALLGLSRVTRGELLEVTIAGGPDAGWLAAVAEWIFSLDVTITGTSGDILYSNHRKETAQVTVIFHKAGEGADQSLQIDSRTYLLEGLSMLVNPNPWPPVSCGRVSWETALSEVFGTDFRTLTSIPEFAKAVGSAARIFQALATVEEGIPDSLAIRNEHGWTFMDNHFFGTRSYGRGFVDNSIEWFPELQYARDIMEVNVQSTFARAISTYKTCFERLRTVCGCCSCRADLAKKVAPTSQADVTKSVTFCLVLTMETIIRASRTLSNCDVLEDLCMLRSGLERAYVDQTHQRPLSDHQEANASINIESELGPIVFCLDMNNGNHGAIKSTRLSAAHRLFGNSNEGSLSQQSAYSSPGICVYLDMLTYVSSNPEAFSRIHVVTGRIELDGKSHDSLFDEYKPNLYAYLNAPRICADESNFQDPVLRVTERARSLYCSISFLYTKDMCNQISASTTGPAKMTALLIGSRNLVRCTHLAGYSNQLYERSCLHGTSLRGPKKTHITFLPGGSSSGQKYRLMAMRAALAGFDRIPIPIIVNVGAQCMECCIKFAHCISSCQQLDRFKGAVRGISTWEIFFVGSTWAALHAVSPHVAGPFSLLPTEENHGRRECGDDSDEWEDIEDSSDNDGDDSEELDGPIPQDNSKSGDASAPDASGCGSGRKPAAKVQRSILRTSHFSVRPRR